MTPHRFTGRCPFEMIKEGPLPSMFPLITSGSNNKSEAKAVRHSIARWRNRRTFEEGDAVVVYCNRFKMSSAGKVTGLLGNNNYLADCGKGPQHVSGDCLSKILDVATRPVGATGHGVQQESHDEVQDEMASDQMDDTRSIVSESPMGSDIIAAPIHGGGRGQVPVRRKRRRADQLGPVQWNLQRLRPRN